MNKKDRKLTLRVDDDGRLTYSEPTGARCAGTNHRSTGQRRKALARVAGSATPITDSMVSKRLAHDDVVPAALARQLERENTRLRAVLSEIAAASRFDNIGNWARNKAKAALANDGGQT